MAARLDPRGLTDIEGRIPGSEAVKTIPTPMLKPRG
jgi:hypothetical protein